ncbi:MAG: hypothetical protein KKF85_00965 [Gammaproteobacteria bacterium]|nr:hypothetical protein [Rhodocyclaceae bacterium]MBU3908214.1 hypothetical protein [Gammaproteobacteria bacterium]MBU3990697.1 hypothetical protein [Gammaproteobacteria bacterium]MBU4003149.1 hypothetical protein [Gammaproteobacteria bacterium]MBU4019991.1 hypothetical protein [Gammaproteobacteria bacterium]
MSSPDKRSVINLASLRWNLTLLFLSILLAATVLAASAHFDRQAESAHKQALARQAETRAKLDRVHEDERKIRAKINLYQELVRQGRTEPEKRLEWVETLRRIKESRRLLDLNYEISPQRPLDAKADGKAPMTGGYDFLASPMKLDLPLLHEDDLLGLLADLSAQVQALVRVNSCKIERSPADPQQQTATLKAHCEIEWITLQQRVIAEKPNPKVGQ